MEEVSERTSTQFSENAACLSFSTACKGKSGFICATDKRGKFYLKKKNAFSVLFFGEREYIMYQISFLAEIRADATTSTVSLIILLLSFVIYNLQ